MIERHPPPGVLFKYVQSDVYNRYLSRGHTRFGLSSFYRKQYELGSGFGDENDGVRSAVFPSLQRSVRTENRHFLLCFSRSYSYSEHVLWLQRQDCAYDACLAFEGPALIAALAKAVREKLGPRIMACGACDYSDHNNQVDALRGNVIGDAFLKPSSYAHEDEYRFSVALSVEDQEAPLDVMIPALPSMVKHIIKLDSP